LKSVSIIGAGAVARSIALALFYGGVKIESIYSLRGVSAQKLSRIVHASAWGSITDVTSLGTHTILCIPDREISGVAKQIARQCSLLKDKTFVHTSGALSSNELLVLKKKGAAVGSFHPMLTFPTKEQTSLKKIWCAIEGDERALRFSRRIAKILGAQTFAIPKEGKVLYHTAGVFASNYVVTLLAVAEQLAASCGISPKDFWKIYQPIIVQTLNNVVKTSPVQALTGPIVRGDVDTVTKHLQALSGKKLNHLVPLYSALGIETARLAKRKKRNVTGV
jgi:predicted short-subunit dehydrogenase-like oxidoreductase (DUF2520 family)